LRCADAELHQREELNMSEWQPIETAPRDGTRILLATPADIEANIASEHYFTAIEGAEAHDDTGGVGGLKDYQKSLGLLTFCVLVLRNGFTVTGESACASPEKTLTKKERSMTDEQLIQAVAELWVENGGDAEGIVWNWSKIRDAVAAIKQEGDAE
jgi:hypothetical protein